MWRACPHHRSESLLECFNQVLLQNPFTLTPLMDIRDEIACSLDADLIRRVGQEVDELEQLKRSAEDQLEERQTYAHFVAKCVKFKEDSDQFVSEDVYTELKNEQYLTNVIISTLRIHIVVLHGQIDSLRDIHNHLYTDFQDKSEAIELMTSCITQSNLQQSPQKRPVSYDQSKSECNKLQNTCKNLREKLSNLRENVQFTLMNLKNACSLQRSSTSRAMRRRIHDMRKKEEQMRWKLKHAQNEMDHLEKRLQRVKKCEERADQNAKYLDALNKRQRNDLCKARAHNIVMLEKCDLTSIATRLERIHRQVHAKMETTRRRIPVVRKELQRQREALQTELKCQDMYQNIPPLLLLQPDP